MALLSDERVACEIIIRALKNDKIPWRNDFGTPRHAITNLSYRGIDLFLLNLAAENYGFTSPYWATFDDWKCLGGIVQARPSWVVSGTWGTEISYPKKTTVFNLQQVCGSFLHLKKLNPNPDYSKIDEFISKTKAEIKFVEKAIAFYHYFSDTITIPPKVWFLCGDGKLAGYYRTVFHELGHWTEQRLDWTNYPVYCDELRAEILSDLLTTEFMVPHLDYEYYANHKDYLANWLELIENDPVLFETIVKSSFAAKDYLLSMAS